MGHSTDGVTLRKEKPDHLQRGTLGSSSGGKEDLKSFRNRPAGEYDGKSFRITIPILRKKDQTIVNKCYHFSLSSSPQLRAEEGEDEMIRVSET